MILLIFILQVWLLHLHIEDTAIIKHQDLNESLGDSILGTETGKFHNKSTISYFILAFVLVFSFSCNNRLSRKIRGGNLNIGGNTGGSTSNDPIRIFNIVPANTDPLGSFTIIGNETIGAFCGYISGSGPTPCRCRYEFTTSSGNEFREADTQFNSTNEITCSYSSLPASATRVQIRINAYQANALSNIITVNMGTGGGTSFLNLKDTASFQKLDRWQARKQHTIFHSYCDDTERCPIDPFQSESNLLSFGINFYTTNRAAGLTRYALATDSNPDPLAHWVIGFNEYRSKISPWQNFTVFSEQPDLRNGSNREGYIAYDPERSKNIRMDAELAKSPSGPFTIPVDAFETPTTIATLGYAAKPSQDSRGNLVCPAPKNNIPDGYHWVLILPTVSLPFPAMEYVRYTEDMSAGRHTAIACNPGVLTNTATRKLSKNNDPAYSRCLSGSGAPTGSLDWVSSASRSASVVDRFADRVFLINSNGPTPTESACMETVATGITSAAISSSLNIPFWDQYSPRTAHSTQATPVMPWNLPRSSGLRPARESQTSTQNIKTQTTRVSETLLEYLFVVTETGTTVSAIEANGINKFYRYKRFRDCPLTHANRDINPTGHSKCKATETISRITYNLSTEKIGTTISDYYPLCGIQKD